MNDQPSSNNAQSVRHAAILASALDAIVTIDSNGTIIEFNPSAEHIFGWKSDQVIGRLLSEVIIPEKYRDAHNQGMKHYLRSGEGPVLGKRIEIEALHYDGHVFPIELTITPIKSESGVVFTAFMRDLTEAKALNQQLSIASFTIEQSNECIYWIDEQSRVIDCNLAAAKSLGFTREEIIGKRIIDIDGNMTEEAWRIHWEGLRTTGSTQLESIHIHADGHSIPVDVSANYIVHNNIEYNCAFVRDITLRKEAQREIFETSQRLELVLGAAEIGFWDWNIVTNEKVVNEEYLRLCGVTRDEFSPDPTWFQSRVHPEDLPVALERLNEHLNQKIERIDSQFRIRQPDGSWRWVHDRGRVVERDDQGKAIRAMGAMQDVTLRRRATEALRESEQRFRDITTSVGEFVWESDEQLQVAFITKPFEKLAGISTDQVLGVSILDMTTPGHREESKNAFHQCIETGQPVRALEFPIQGAGDTLHWVRLNAQPILDRNAKLVGFRGTGLDITQERSAQEAKRRSVELQHLARSIIMDLLKPGELTVHIESLLMRLGEFLNADRAYLLRNQDHLDRVICSVNWFSHRVNTGDEAFPIANASLSRDWINTLKPDQPLIAYTPGAQAMPSWIQPDTMAHIGIPVLIDGNPVNYLGFDWVDTSHAMLEQDVPTLQSIASSLGYAIERRITKRELELTAQQLANEATRAESANHAKSVFLAQMSHELRTPLTAVLGSAEILAANPDDLQRRKGLLTSIESNGKSLLALINSVLDLSRYERGETPLTVERVGIRDLVDQVRSSVMPIAMLEGVAVEFEAKTLLPAHIMTDSFQLAQVLINLISNSIKYAQSTSIRVEFQLSSNTAGQLQIMVIDQGIGIEPMFIERMFEPFERSRSSTAPGTGLGLAICKRIIDALDGTIECVSIPWHETKFTCTIPLSAVGEHSIPAGPFIAQPSAPDDQQLDKKALDGVRILLVEDSPHVRDVMEYFLADMGGDVHAVEDGQQAVEYIAEHESEIDVVLMDMQMPRLDGYQATRQLKANGCSLPIIAVTAHGLAEDRKKCIDAGCDDYLSKPVNPGLLAVAIRRAMARPLTEPSAPGTASDQIAASPLSHLVQRYREHLIKSIDELRYDPDELDHLQRLTHQIKGTSGTMGLASISDCAKEAEQALRNGAPAEDIRACLLALINAIRT